jgi:cell division protein FtsB
MSDQPVTVTNSDVVDRLARLRAVLPLMATDLAVARRRATALHAENEQLRRRVDELEAKLAELPPAVPPRAARRTPPHLRRARHAPAR